MSYQQYFRRFFSGAALLALIIIVFNLLIDPMDVFRIIKIPHINFHKTKYDALSRFGKPLQIELLQPDRIVLGSSRVMLGIPVEHKAWSKGKGLNVGLTSASMRTVADVFEHATQVSSVDDVLISTDLFMFNASQQLEYPHRLAKEDEPLKDSLLRRASTLGEALFTPNITFASMQTLVKQGERHNKFLPSGQANPENEKRRSVHDGYKRRFLQFEDSLVRLAWSRCRDNQLPFEKDGVDGFDGLDRVLRIAAEKKIRLRFFISPVHARILELMSAAGYWDEFEKMKHELVVRVENAKANYPDLDVEIWDFSGYSSITTEPLPLKSGDAMQWYYDSSHFSNEVGVLMEDIIYTESPDQNAKPSFGIRLDSRNIQQHLESLRLGQRNYRDINKEQYEEISQFVSAIFEDKKKSGQICTPLASE